MIPLGSKLTPTQVSQVGTWERRRPTSKFFFSETGRDRVLILVDLCKFHSYDAPWDQNWPHPGGHKLETKEQRFICGENDSGERSRAIMALLLVCSISL